MIINIKDKIIYAIYGNDDYMINVKNIIQILQKNKTKQIVINNDNMNYNNNNEKYKYLIIKINNSIFTINNYDIIYFEYTNIPNIIIVRTDLHIYWVEWYNKLLQHYKNYNIYIIYDFDSKNEILDIPTNITIIENNMYNKGIYLGYYYIIKNKLEGEFIVLNDKIILNKVIKKANINQNLFNFDHKWKIDNKYIFEMINLLSNSKTLFNEFNDRNWYGCFKGLSFIDSILLNNIEQKFNFTNLINIINNNYYDMAFERLIGVCIYHFTKNNKSIFGDIHTELSNIKNSWNFSYENYIENNDNSFNYIFK